VEFSLERRLREADVGSQSADTIKLSFSSCSNLWKRRASPVQMRVLLSSLKPMNEFYKSSPRSLKNGWRTLPSADFARYSISASNEGSIQTPKPDLDALR
jgi:hypothetical protein